MLTIDLRIQGKEKDNLSEDKKRVAFDGQMNSVGTRSCAHRVFDY